MQIFCVLVKCGLSSSSENLEGCKGDHLGVGWMSLVVCMHPSSK